MDALWQGIFWLAVAGIAYTYVGYGLLVSILAKCRPMPVQEDDVEPSVTVLVAAYNEEDCIEDKIENTLGLDYPRAKLDLVVVADGSTDRTCEMVQEAARCHRNVRLLHVPERAGKVGALNRAFPLTRGEAVLFTDANTQLPANTLRRLVRPLADPSVGATSGTKRMLRSGDVTAEQGEGIYWRYESYLKQCDSAISSVMGVPGEIWVARREAYIPPDADSLLDDFVASMRMVAAGWRVVFDPEAIAYEEASPSLRAEWTRRSRNASGGWQAYFQLRKAMQRAPALVRWQYLSHRMLRWMVTPSLFVLFLASNLFLLGRPVYAIISGCQGMFYLAALAGWLMTQKGRRIKWLLAPFYIVMLNAAALVGGWRFLRGRQTVLWQKVR